MSEITMNIRHESRANTAVDKTAVFDHEFVKKSFALPDGSRTSVALEQVFWDYLKEMAARKNTSVRQLVVERRETQARNHNNNKLTGMANLASKLRVLVLRDCEDRLFRGKL